jgi:AraC-like DNA-binding protein
VGDSMSEISNQHQSVVFLCDYERVLDESDLVLTYERMTATKQNRCYKHDGVRSIEETERFFSAIMQKDYRTARDSMDELIQYLLGDVDIQVMPLSLAKARLGYLINTLDIAVDSLRLRIDSSIFSDMFPRLDFRECDNVQDFKVLSNRIFDEFIQRDQGEEKGNGYSYSWVSDVKRYVDGHFTNLDLNVNFLATEFNLNASYMSRIFRAKVGIGLPDYIQNVRLRQAKTLLSAGATVSEAAELSGFGSARSMSRAFQKTAGTTPGKYRDIHGDTKHEVG